MRISDWSSDVCSSDLNDTPAGMVPDPLPACHFGLTQATGSVRSGPAEPGCRSSVVEHLIGNEEVDSSILSGSTSSFPLYFHDRIGGSGVPAGAEGVPEALWPTGPLGNHLAPPMNDMSDQQIGRASGRERVCTSGEISVVAVQ